MATLTAKTLEQELQEAIARNLELEKELEELKSAQTRPLKNKLDVSAGNRESSGYQSFKRNKGQQQWPTDRYERKFVEIFQHTAATIIADTPTPGEKASWKTQNCYIEPTNIIARWQAPDKLIGVRFGSKTNYALIDIDTNSQYHYAQDSNAINKMQGALEERLGINKTLIIQSSWSEGVHLYIPLPKMVNSFHLASSLFRTLHEAGFDIAPGTLEIFPNCRKFDSDHMAHRLPLQEGSFFLDSDFHPLQEETSLVRFIEKWETCATQQDIEILSEILQSDYDWRREFQKKTYGANVKSSKLRDWKEDLERVMSVGWTDHGQTNIILWKIGVYARVFKCATTMSEVMNFIVETAPKCPGFYEWSRHVKELKVLAKHKAVSIMESHKPLTEYRRTGVAGLVVKEKNLNYNKEAAQEASARIMKGMDSLIAQDVLESNVEARMAQLQAECQKLFGTKPARSTLYKKETKILWHPQYIKENKREGVVEPSHSMVSGDLLHPLHMKGLNAPPTPALSGEKKRKKRKIEAPAPIGVVEPSPCIASKDLLTPPHMKGLNDPTPPSLPAPLALGPLAPQIGHTNIDIEIGKIEKTTSKEVVEEVLEVKVYTPSPVGFIHLEGYTQGSVDHVVSEPVIEKVYTHSLSTEVKKIDLPTSIKEEIEIERELEIDTPSSVLELKKIDTSSSIEVVVEPSLLLGDENVEDYPREAIAYEDILRIVLDSDRLEYEGQTTYAQIFTPAQLAAYEKFQAEQEQRTNRYQKEYWAKRFNKDSANWPKARTLLEGAAVRMNKNATHSSWLSGDPDKVLVYVIPTDGQEYGEGFAVRLLDLTKLV